MRSELVKVNSLLFVSIYNVYSINQRNYAVNAIQLLLKVTFMKPYFYRLQVVDFFVFDCSKQFNGQLNDRYILEITVFNS